MPENSVLEDTWNKKRLSTVEGRLGTPIKAQNNGLNTQNTDENSSSDRKCISTIQVFIRTRPCDSIDGKSCVLADPHNSNITVQFPHTSARKIGCVSNEMFHFERGVFDEHITQEELFNRIGIKSASKVWDGFNVTFFAYGQVRIQRYLVCAWIQIYLFFRLVVEKRTLCMGQVRVLASSLKARILEDLLLES